MVRKLFLSMGKISAGSPPAGALYWNGSNSSFVQGAKLFFKEAMSALQTEIMVICLLRHKEEMKDTDMPSLCIQVGFPQ